MNENKRKTLTQRGQKSDEKPVVKPEKSKPQKEVKRDDNSNDS